MRKVLLRKHGVRGAVSCTVESESTFFFFQKTELLELWISGTVKCIGTPLKKGTHPTLKRLLYL